MNDLFQELINTDIAFSKLSEEKGAAIAFRQFLTKTAIMLPQNNKPLLGIEEIYKSMNQSNSKEILSWKPKGGRVSKSGDLGYTWGIYTLKISENKIIEGKYLNIWVKQKDGTWKVDVDMGNMNSK